MKKLSVYAGLLLFALLVAVPLTKAGKAAGPLTVPVPDMVTLVDLGAHTCVPCKMMAPILEELKKEYKGKAAVIFIDVWENSNLAKKFKVSMIPTQVFFDREGKEIYRHVGFMDKQSIVDRLDYMLEKK